MKDPDEKPKIEYPTRWGYKIIGRDKHKLLECIKEILSEKEHTCTVGNSSKKGTFHTYNASCEVVDEKERDEIFKAFQDHDSVDMVI